MTKKLQLQIPTPCHENWEKMTTTEKGRFCASCQKQVMDFTNKSDREIAMFFKKPSIGSVCGRFMDDQLNRDIDLPKKRIPWLKYFFQFLIPAFFISYRATAQGKVKVASNVTTQFSKLSNMQYKQLKEKIESEACMRNTGLVVTNLTSIDYPDITVKKPGIELNNSISGTIGLVSSSGLNEIKGRVVDEGGNAIPFATIMIKGTKNATSTDANGSFSIYPKPDWKDITLIALSVGFNTQEINIDRANYNSPDTIMLIPMRPQPAGEVVIVGYTLRKTKKQKPVPLLQRIFKDTAFSKFRIYPNPARSNSTLNIEWKQKEFGDHLLRLFNQSGQLLLSKDLYIDEKTRLFTITMPSIIPGNYFLKLTSKISARSYTEKLIVE